MHNQIAIVALVATVVLTATMVGRPASCQVQQQQQQQAAYAAAESYVPYYRQQQVVQPAAVKVASPAQVGEILNQVRNIAQQSQQQQQQQAVAETLAATSNSHNVNINNNVSKVKMGNHKETVTNHISHSIAPVAVKGMASGGPQSTSWSQQVQQVQQQQVAAQQQPAHATPEQKQLKAQLQSLAAGSIVDPTQGQKLHQALSALSAKQLPVDKLRAALVFNIMVFNIRPVRVRGA